MNLHDELQATLDHGVTEDQIRKVTGLGVEALRNYSKLSKGAISREFGQTHSRLAAKISRLAITCDH